MKAFASNNATFTLNGDFTIQADLTSTQDVDTVGVSGAAISVGVLVAYIKDTAQVESQFKGIINNIDWINFDNNVNIISNVNTDLTVTAVGVTVGGVAVGVTTAIVKLKGSVQSSIEDSLIYTNNLNVASNLTLSANSNVTNAAGAVAAVGVSVATASIGSSSDRYTVKTYIKNSSLYISGSSKVNANINPAAKADVTGVTVAGIGVGVSVAVADVYLDIDTYLQNCLVYADELIVSTKYSLDDSNNPIEEGAKAFSDAIGGGILSGNGAESDANNKPLIDTFVTGTVNIGANLVISSDAYVYTYADANGVAVGAVGMGGSTANATSQATNIVYFSGEMRDNGINPTDQTDTVTIIAHTTDRAIASTVSGAGGILAGSGSVAKAKGLSTTHTYIGDNAEIYWAESVDFKVEANGTPQVEANAFGINVGGLSVGLSFAYAISEPEIKAWLGENVIIRFGASLTQNPQLEFANNPNAVFSIFSITDTFTYFGSQYISINGNIYPYYDALVRTTGSWLEDGFTRGSLIRVSSDDFSQSYIYRILDISEDGLRMTLTEH